MKRYYILLLILVVSSSSCQKFLEIDPPSSSLDMVTAFTSDAGAISLITGVYTQASGSYSTGFNGLSLSAGLSADELTGYNQSSEYDAFYRNSLSASNFYNFWADFYVYIYAANQTIEGLNAPNGVSAQVKDRLLGEAKFIRAYFYFYLVNLFGDVPLATTTTYTNNMTMARSPKAEVYKLIVEDLLSAQILLGTAYTGPDLKTTTEERVRPNKWAATALLARVYLFTGDYNKAVEASSQVIAQSGTYQLENLASAFLTTSKETIFSLQGTDGYRNTYEGNTFIFTYGPSYSNPASLSDYVYNAFEAGDSRKVVWVGTYSNADGNYRYPYKYKVRSSGQPSMPLTENQVLLRLGEQYLIRAEAYIQTNRVALGVADLNTIRARARAAASGTVANPLPALSTTIAAPLAMEAVEKERKVEMFTELGDRWFTLKRLKGFDNPSISRADEIMPAITLTKGGTWDTNWQLYPIPLSEMRKDPKLAQNEGYK